MITKSIFTAAALLALLPIAASAQGIPAIPTTTTLMYPNGDPATDATVVIDTVDNSTHAVTTTTCKPDSTGKVTVPAGAHPSWATSRVVYVTSATGVGFLSAGPPGVDTTTVLEPFTSVRIHLIDSSGKAIRFVKIAAHTLSADGTYGAWSGDIPSDWTETTDDQGYATLPKLPQGYNLLLSIMDKRYADPGQTSLVHLADLPTSPDATVQISAAAAISGKVLFTSTGKPAPGILVLARLIDSASPLQRATADANGAFIITKLSPGAYSVATAPSKAYADWVSAAQEITVKLGTDQTGVNVTLIHGGLIKGAVTDAAGHPMPQTIVAAFTGMGLAGSPNVVGAKTNPDGTFSLRVSPGTLTIKVFGSGVPANNAGQQVTIEEGETKTVNLQASAAPANTGAQREPISGHIVGPNGNPLPNADVYFMSGHMIYNLKTDSLGNFPWYTDTFKANDTVLARWRGLGTPGVVVYDGKMPLTLHLSKDTMCTLTGQVNTPDGKPDPYAKVNLDVFFKDSAMLLDTGQCDSNGQFTFPGVFGNSKYNITAYATGCADSYASTVTQAQGQTEQIPTITLGAANNFVGGTVVDSKGSPVANATVNAPGVTDLKAVTDQAGHFMIKNVPDGKHYVWVTGPNNATASQRIESGRGDNIIYLYNNH